MGVRDEGHMGVTRGIRDIWERGDEGHVGVKG